MRRIEVVAAVLCVAAGAPLVAQEDSQGFLRVVEGAATLIRVEDGQPEAARENTPALAGDRLSLAPGSRVEVILPDGHRLRLAESADLELVALARSLDESGAATALQLSRGVLAIDVPREAVDRTRVDTDAAAVLLERGGLYLVEIDERGATRVVVREGDAEVLTEYGTTPVRAGDEAVIAPDSSARVALYQAPPLTAIEEWARQLEAEAAQANVEPVDPGLRYAALPLARHGGWVDSGAGYAWRPRVEAGWRPYWRGYWKYSPAGLVWCSYEPWGWVPYHYGNWDLHPSYGWLWYPGRVYRPAHVVWYWGSSYAGWVPSGYYGSFYARRFGFNLSFGTGFYGVSHASWHAYRDWVFCPTSSIGHRYQYRYHGDHRVLNHDGHSRGFDRGFITADTRGLDRGRWRDSAAVEEVFTRRAHRRTGGASDLPDLSAVVARSTEVSSTTLRELDSGDDQRQVAVHRRPGPKGDGATPAEPAVRTLHLDTPSTPSTPSTRVAPRRPTVLADDGVARQVPARVKGAESNTPSDSGRTAVRAHRSTGLETLETKGAPVETKGTPAVRDRAGERTVPKVEPSVPKTDAGSAAVPQSRVLRRTTPGVESGRLPYDSGRGQRRVEVDQRDQAPAARSNEAPATPAQRKIHLPRDYEAPPTEARARVARPQLERVAPQQQQQPPQQQQPRATVERSYAPRSVPREQLVRSQSPATAPRARVEVSRAPRSAPPAQAERSYAPRSAPAARVERSYTPQSAPPGHRAASASRSAPAAASAPAPAPRRMESSRPAAAAESRASSSSSSSSSTSSSSGAKSSSTGGGRAHARDAGGSQSSRGAGSGRTRTSGRH